MAKQKTYTGNQVEIGGVVYTYHHVYRLKLMATLAARKLVKQGHTVKVLVSDAAGLCTSIFHPDYFFALKRYAVYKRGGVG